jgi:hypothetical protein
MDGLWDMKNLFQIVDFKNLLESFVIVRTHRGTLWVLIFDFIHPVTSGTKMINFTLNTPYNNYMR